MTSINLQYRQVWAQISLDCVEQKASTTGRNVFVGFVGKLPEAMMRRCRLQRHLDRPYRSSLSFVSQYGPLGS